VEKRWNEAGQAFEREAACRQQGNENNDAMNAFKNAANAYKKTNPEGMSRLYYTMSARGMQVIKADLYSRCIGLA
jgi:alpha-soluble NSF attachment protein